MLTVVAFFPNEFWKGHYYIFLCAIPALYPAVLEDLGIRVRPAIRLAATFVAAALYMIVTGEFIPRVGISLIDCLVAEPIFAFALSVVVVTAAVHSMNLIDGLNGLCSGVTVLIFICLAYAAQEAHLTALFYLATTNAIVALGFFVVNYPSGSLFLGDTGAYWIGFSLSLTAIYFLRCIDTFAPPAMLLIFFWPAFELSITVCRRLASGRRLFSPDSMHTHQIAMRIVRANLSHAPQAMSVANPIASFVTLLLAAPPMILGAAFWNNPRVAWVALLLCILTYASLYVWAAALTRRRPLSCVARG